MTIAVVLLDGMRSFDLAAVLEVFADDGRRGGVVDEVRLVSPRAGVVLEHGLTVSARPLADLAGAELVLVPGFADVARWLAAPDAREREVADALRAAHAAGAQLASLCTGAFLLARTGLLDGVAATTHWRHASLLAELHPAVRVDPHVLYTHDEGRRLWTSAGVAAGVDLCLALVADRHGSAAAADVARSMVLPAVRSGGQAQYVPARYGQHETRSGGLVALQDLVRRDLGRAWTLAELASAARTSPRSLQRRFGDLLGMSPSQWLVQERLTAARELLEGSVLGVEQVAQRVGFGSSDLFRKHFAAQLGVSPSRYREAFALRAAVGPRARRS